jgi:hypothetical protein
MTVLRAAERLPSPHAVTGVVSSIIPEHVLVVRISDNENGYARSAWREAHAALRRSEHSGWRDAAPTVWASTDNADKVASATAGDPVFGGLLRFSFADEAAFMRLASQPGLSAFVIVDRQTQRFLSVKFRNRQS